MAYFDDPGKRAMWERELAHLREQRETASGKGRQTPPPEEPEELSWNAVGEDVPAMSAPEDDAVIPDVDVNWAEPRPVRELITLEQLEADAGMRSPVTLRADEHTPSKQPPQISQS